MAGIFDIGKTGLDAAQVRMSVIGHNIANVNTEGYSRQNVTQENAEGQNFSFGFIGHGTRLTNIKRSYNEFLGREILNAQANQSDSQAQYQQVKQIDNLLGDASISLAPALENFFAGLQGVTADANSTPARQSFLSAAQQLVGRFNDMSDRINQIRADVEGQVVSSVQQVNTLATQIAKLNNLIAQAEQGNSNQQANDLRDQRDNLATQLSQVIQTTTVEQADGTYNVFIGSGQPLVINTTVSRLAVTESAEDLTRNGIALKTATGSVIELPETSLTGGALGGLLEFRRTTLDQTQSALGRMATAFTSTMNAQHRLGIDQKGRQGGDLFSVSPPFVIANTHNTGNAQLSAAVVDATALTGSDYRLQFNGAQYQVTRLSDGQQQSFASLPQTVDGVQFTLNSGAFATNDSFVIRPTFNGANQLQLLVNDTTTVAAAAPVVAAKASSNTGNGSISDVQIDTNYWASPLSSALTLTYDASTQTVGGFPAGQPISVTRNNSTTNYAAGSNVPWVDRAIISFGGIQFTARGQPNNADTFTLGPNVGGVGDNRNAVKLGKLQSTPLLNGGSATYQDVYAQLVNQIGNRTQELQVGGDAQQKLLTQIQQTQQAESGVNLDEEAANLMETQQAYNAAAQVMKMAQSMFDAILQLGQ